MVQGGCRRELSGDLRSALVEAYSVEHWAVGSLLRKFKLRVSYHVLTGDWRDLVRNFGVCDKAMSPP
jgi:hypothetical protein